MAANKADPAAMWFLFFLLGGVGGGIGVAGWQALQWLRFAAWEPVSVVTGLRWLGVRWATEPRDWYGLWKILYEIPLSAGLVGIGIVGCWLVMTMDDSRARTTR